MKFKIIFLTRFAVAKFIFCLTIFAPTVYSAVPQNIHAFVNKINQNAAIQKQKNALSLQKFNASIKRLGDDKSPTTNPISLALQNPSAETPEINCAGANDEYNYPSNFVYNENNQKIYRLHPFAKCITSAPTAQAPVAMQSDNTTEKKETSTQWNINY